MGHQAGEPDNWIDYSAGRAPRPVGPAATKAAAHRICLDFIAYADGMEMAVALPLCGSGTA